MPTIKDLENLFEGEVLHIVGDYLPIGEMIQIEKSFVLGIDGSYGLYPNLMFWASDNFSRDWPRYCESNPDSTTRIFAPLEKGKTVETSLLQRIFFYEPFPLWVMPPSEVQSWLKSDQGDKCPVGWGSLCLGLGLGYRLGFRRISLVGCTPRSGQRWDLDLKKYRDLSEREILEKDHLDQLVARVAQTLTLEIERR